MNSGIRSDVMAIDVFREAVEQVGLVIDAGGVVVVVLGILVAVGRLLFRPATAFDRYRQFRQDLGRVILLGLEFLVAADIIRTVAVTPTLESVLVLGLIVIIRTFLSLALQLEVEGRLPWQTAQDGGKSSGAGLTGS